MNKTIQFNPWLGWAEIALTQALICTLQINSQKLHVRSKIWNTVLVYKNSRYTLFFTAYKAVVDD